MKANKQKQIAVMFYSCNGFLFLVLFIILRTVVMSCSFRCDAAVFTIFCRSNVPDRGFDSFCCDAADFTFGQAAVQLYPTEGLSIECATTGPNRTTPTSTTNEVVGKQTLIRF